MFRRLDDFGNVRSRLQTGVFQKVLHHFSVLVLRDGRPQVGFAGLPHGLRQFQSFGHQHGRLDESGIDHAHLNVGLGHVQFLSKSLTVCLQRKFAAHVGRQEWRTRTARSTTGSRQDDTSWASHGTIFGSVLQEREKGLYDTYGSQKVNVVLSLIHVHGHVRGRSIEGDSVVLHETCQRGVARLFDRFDGGRHALVVSNI
mmetsp:Transcript_18599/g.34653  ORF Transcript_18599/g.34653 Transcript_18599/m.34653 type:complete len:200 (+) Transcript_18599:496-1095(+)